MIKSWIYRHRCILGGFRILALKPRMIQPLVANHHFSYTNLRLDLYQSFIMLFQLNQRHLTWDWKCDSSLKIYHFFVLLFLSTSFYWILHFSFPRVTALLEQGTRISSVLTIAEADGVLLSVLSLLYYDFIIIEYHHLIAIITVIIAIITIIMILFIVIIIYYYYCHYHLYHYPQPNPHHLYNYCYYHSQSYCSLVLTSCWEHIQVRK